ncbi:Gluconolactonase precursor [Anatilimnocola aggregata]|uniref:Gluconolactonase n=1 Tax=Anatilimnocola aggregata TaxID=2528021 RepID=A0A517Y5K5_9BACT|nr:SMP-30/gluconolactonase/LRE family protein [Anatilimnocola aggregata]QDU25524.1 Gluconolactonase precursor [Anatilimnocola aggregata]
MRRRQFLQTAAAVSAGCLCHASLPTGQAAGVADQYAGLKTADYLGELTTLAKVVDRKVFTEGPCCDRAGNVYFTSTEVNKILKWDGKELTTFRENSGGANGLLFDQQGRLVACEGVAGRVTRTDLSTGGIEVLVDQFNGHPLGAPNDLCFDAKGRIYFTSRLPNLDPAKGNVNSVYRIDVDGKVAQVVHAPDIHMPNGIVISPDDKTLYLIEAHPQADFNRCILSFPLQADGTLGKGTRLIDFYPGRSGDGMAIDEQGNLYVAAGLHAPRKTSETLDTRPGIHVISPSGKLLAFVQTPEDTITNCRFGGADLKTLYITCGSLLLSLPTKIAGKASYRPEK